MITNTLEILPVLFSFFCVCFGGRRVGLSAPARGPSALGAALRGRDNAIEVHRELD